MAKTMKYMEYPEVVVEKKRDGGMVMWKKRWEKKKRNIRTGENRRAMQNQELSMNGAEEMQKG